MEMRQVGGSLGSTIGSVCRRVPEAQPEPDGDRSDTEGSLKSRK